MPKMKIGKDFLCPTLSFLSHDWQPSSGDFFQLFCTDKFTNVYIGANVYDRISPRSVIVLFYIFSNLFTFTKLSFKFN